MFRPVCPMDATSVPNAAGTGALSDLFLCLESVASPVDRSSPAKVRDSSAAVDR